MNISKLDREAQRASSVEHRLGTNYLTHFSDGVYSRAWYWILYNRGWFSRLVYWDVMHVFGTSPSFLGAFMFDSPSRNIILGHSLQVEPCVHCCLSCLHEVMI
jgi:hypothetical protein